MLPDPFCFECYGARIGITGIGCDVDLFNAVRPPIYAHIPADQVETWLDWSPCPNGNIQVSRDRNVLIVAEPGYSISLMTGEIDLAVARNIGSELVAMHGASVSIQGFAVIFPGASHSGKSRLAKAFIERGAHLLADDLVIIDRAGFVHPYPRDINHRINPRESRRLVVSSVGMAKEPARLRQAHFLQYSKQEQTCLEQLKPSIGIIHMLEYCFARESEPVRTLNKLCQVAKDVDFFHGNRGEAEEFAELVTESIENEQGCNCAGRAMNATIRGVSSAGADAASVQPDREQPEERRPAHPP